MEQAGELSEVDFEKYVAEESEEILSKYNVRTVPTLIFENGARSSTYTGIQSKEKIKSILESLTSPSETV